MWQARWTKASPGLLRRTEPSTIMCGADRPCVGDFFRDGEGWEDVYMGMRLSYMAVAVAALLTAACPYDHLLTSNRGFAIGGGGGGGTGPDALAFTVQPSSATAGNI